MLSIAVSGAGRMIRHAKTIRHFGAASPSLPNPFGDAAQKLAGLRLTTDVDSVFTDEGSTPSSSAHTAASPALAAARPGGRCAKPIALDMKDVEAARDELNAFSVPLCSASAP